MKLTYPNPSLHWICGLFGVTRQAYYKHQKKSAMILSHHEQVLQLVLEKRHHHPSLGGRKLYHLLCYQLRSKGIKLGRDAFFDLLSSHDLLIKNKKRKVLTTYSRHWLRKYPNLIKGLPIQAVNQVWVSDITYWPWKEKFLYLSLITDAYSRKIVGYELSDTLETINSQRALHMAISHSNGSLQGMIHHSDRGIQYCSHQYIKMLKDHGILVSMTEKGDPLENPIAERVNGIIKSEYLKYYKAKDLDHARQLVNKAIKLYNQERPHTSCGMYTPQIIYSTNIKPKRLWKNYWKNTNVNQQQDLQSTVNE